MSWMSQNGDGFNGWLKKTADAIGPRLLLGALILCGTWAAWQTKRMEDLGKSLQGVRESVARIEGRLDVTRETALDNESQFSPYPALED